MIEQAFEVATEFKFDVGQAIISSKALQDAVGDVSKAADGAMTSLNYLASGLVAHLGFGSGGLLSILTKAVQISEAFNSSALNFANNISSNIGVLSGTIGTFNDKLSTSKMIMGNIADAAINVGVDTGQLAHISQMLATPLANRGKLGTNYSGAINMGKNLMLGSEAVGLHPQTATESLYRAITDNMPLHGALFARMVNTQAFKSAHIGKQGQLMNMNQDKKIDLLNHALEQLAGDADWLTNRMNNIGVQFTVLKDQIEVVLRPIGDAIIKPIRMILQGVNQYLKTHGKEIGDNLAKLISSIFEDPKKLFVNLMQLKSMGSDFKKALHLTELFQLFVFLRWGLGMIGIQLSGGLLRTGLVYLIDGLAALGAWFWRVGMLGKIFGFLKMAIGEVLPIFGAFLFFFQIISRARAIAHLADVENLLNLTPRITALFVRLKEAMGNILLPINMAIDFWARLIAPLFETSTWLNVLLPVFETFADVLDTLGKATVYAMAIFSAFNMMMIGFFSDLVNLKNPLTNLADNATKGFQDFMGAHPFNQDPSKAVMNQVTNVGKIEARFDMREQLEPDRIAFAVTTHLKKLAMNPTQGRGNSLGTALAGNQGFAGAR